MTDAALLAIGWSPEIRGIVVVLIGIGVLCGSIYLLLTTNLGSRLGFLVALAGLTGWLMMLGIFWWVYGIGLKGKDPTWVAKEVIGGSLSNAGTSVARVDNLGDATTSHPVDGWIRIAEDDPSFGQATAASDDILQNKTQIFKAGDYKPIAVYTKGGGRFPKINDSLDFLAFFHKPHYALVEVQPVIPALTEPGRAPPTPTVDPSKSPTYVLMERDLGTRRQPAVTLTLGAGLLFALCCYTLHRRDQTLRANLEAAKAVVPVRVPS
jgi:hypothetical protein